MRSCRLLAVFAALFLTAPAVATDFLHEQLSIARVREAREAKSAVLKELFAKQGLAYPPKGVFLRVFKLDRELELWGQAPDGSYRLVKTYPICASSGTLGPKRQEGDGQVPEGFYRIGVFNPRSNFHLSLGIDYPNASDRIRGDRKHLGGAIMIHGSCVTIGCVPITDPLIDEVYVAALEARAQGQAVIEAHFFPARLTEAGWRRLERDSSATTETLSFWHELKAGFDAFEETHQPPIVRVDSKGRYQVTRNRR
jgi:murein L,D-transpeptidase YafK